MIRNVYGASVLGIDLSSNMIEIAKERLVKHNIEDIVFEIKDATTQKYDEASFDVVYSSHGILYFV